MRDSCTSADARQRRSIPTRLPNNTQLIYPLSQLRIAFQIRSELLERCLRGRFCGSRRKMPRDSGFELRCQRNEPRPRALLGVT